MTLAQPRQPTRREITLTAAARLTIPSSATAQSTDIAAAAWRDKEKLFIRGDA
jgi:hypothetical protein